MTITALIPCRAQSSRLPGKNMRVLAGRPLLFWTIDAAKASGIFEAIIVSTDTREIVDKAQDQGVSAMISRPPSHVGHCPDIIWVRDALRWKVLRWRRPSDAFAIVRVTSPFRFGSHIREAWRRFQNHQPCDSLRAMRLVREHPAKMWKWDVEHGPYVSPAVEGADGEGRPWHSLPTQLLPTYYVQTAGLEIAWWRTVTELGTIAGKRVLPFLLDGPAALDINTDHDWQEAQCIAEQLSDQRQTHDSGDLVTT